MLVGVFVGVCVGVSVCVGVTTKAQHSSYWKLNVKFDPVGPSYVKFAIPHGCSKSLPTNR